MPWRSLRAVSRFMIRRSVRLVVEGADLLPAKGPVIVAARHFHHLYDGCALLATIARPSHILVAGDWTRNPIGRQVMTRACAAAAWPVVLRPGGPGKVSPRDAAIAFRLATAQSIDIFRAGHVLIVFPEGYPNIDPGYTPKPDESSFLPFQGGVVRLASKSGEAGLTVPIVPAGFAYSKTDRWNITLRFGHPVVVGTRDEEELTLQHLEESVRVLSR
jgi:putative membrane protein